MENHHVYMRRCLELAATALGETLTNPMVGAVLVYDGQIISEGFHKGFGLPHAEVDAISKITDNELLSKCTLYVSLEPCCHYGKTPPCTSLILSSGIKRVIVATLDPNPLVHGKGVEELRRAGVDVLVGVLDQEARWLNRRFFTFHQKQRPYVILKWAQSKDGFIDIHRKENEKGIRWISHPYTRQLVHQWRSQEMAILVGRKTIQIDNPLLTTRLWNGRHPVRIVIDPSCSLKPFYFVFSDDSPTFVFHDNQHSYTDRFSSSVRFFPVSFNKSHVLQDILSILYKENILSIIVEGGKYTLEQFLQNALWDEIRIIEGSASFGSGVKAPILPFYPAQMQLLETDIIRFIYR